MPLAGLDIGWDLAAVKEAAAAAVDIAGEDSAHFRPEEEFNSHKITLGKGGAKLDPAA